MLSRREVAAIAERHGLAAWAARLTEIVEPGWRLGRDDTTDPPRPGASKLGGEPDLAVNETWPVNDRGIALTFLAQIDCSSLPTWAPEWQQPAVWPHEGRLLRLFANLVDNPVGTDPARILNCATGTPLRRVAAPPLPDPWPAGGPFDIGEPEERHVQLAEACLTARPLLGVPTYPAPNPLSFVGDDGLETRYLRWAAEIMEERDEARTELAHWLLGPAISTNVDDVRDFVTWRYDSAVGIDTPSANLRKTNTWTCLLHISDDESLGVELGGGALTLVIPREDLARGAYDRAFCAVQP